MKPIITAAIIAATATSAAADQATYDNYTESLTHAVYCHAAYDSIIFNHMETLLESRGEEFVTDMIEQESQLSGDIMSIGIEAVTDKNMSVIERKRFQNNLPNTLNDPYLDAILFLMDLEKNLGAEAAVDIILERCPMH